MIPRQVPVMGEFGRREHGHREGPLKAHERRHDLAPDAHQGHLGEVAGVAFHQAAQDGRLARGAQIGAGGGSLDAAHLLRSGGAPHEKIVHAVVDLVDLAAQGVERGVGGTHGQVALNRGRIVVVGDAGKIKENVDSASACFLRMHASP